MPLIRLPLIQIAGMRRHGSPTLLQPDPEGATLLHELVNTDASEPGRVQGRPADRDVYERGSSGDPLFPRSLSSSS